MEDTKNKLYKVGIYLRLSNEDKYKNNEENISESIKNQRYLLLDYISKRKNFILIDEYIDENLSGAGTYRPEFERLINDCKNKKIDIVLCKSQSRFSRDVEIIEKYIHNKFIEWNIRFIGLSDNTDTNIPNTKKSRQINSLINEWYLEDVSNNIKSAFKAKMLNGEYISPFCCYGYKIDKNNNNKLIIDNEVSNIVRNIFLLYINGYGFMKIAKYLNDNNIPSPSYYKYLKGIKLNIVSKNARNNIKWSSNSIKSILTNQIYIGHLIQGKRTTISYKNHKIIKKDPTSWIKSFNTHESIIDKELFNKVQILINNKTKYSKYKNTNLFTNKVYCSLCNSKFKKKKSNKYNYLVCSNSQYNLCSNKHSIRYDKLEEIILENINILINNFYDKNILNNLFNNDKFLQNKLNYLEKEYINIKNKISKNDLYIKNLYEDKFNNKVLNDRFNMLISYYEKLDINYKNKLKYLNNNIKLVKDFNNTKHDNILNSYKKINKLNNIFIEYLIDKITISDVKNNNRIINITWF